MRVYTALCLSIVSLQLYLVHTSASLLVIIDGAFVILYTIAITARGDCPVALERIGQLRISLSQRPRVNRRRSVAPEFRFFRSRQRRAGCASLRLIKRRAKLICALVGRRALLPRTRPGACAEESLDAPRPISIRPVLSVSSPSFPSHLPAPAV